jgi:hypothetical protein
MLCSHKESRIKQTHLQKTAPPLMLACCHSSQPVNPWQASVTSQIEQQKVFLQPPGSDGRPLLIVRGSRHVPADMETCKRFITYSLEAASRLCDHPNSLDHKLWAMFDLKGLRWANLDARALRSSFQVLSSAFPERVHKIYMLDAPAIFDTIWQLVKPFIDPVSRTKIRFISRESGVRELQQMLDAEVLPKRYVGVVLCWCTAYVVHCS